MEAVAAPAIEANSNTPVQIINALMARPQPPAKIYYYVPPPVEGPAGGQEPINPVR